MSWHRRPWETSWDFLAGDDSDLNDEVRPSLWDEASDEEREAAEQRRLEEEEA